MKVLFLISLSLFLILKTGTIQAHPLHLTITNIDITNNSIKIVIRLFKDDFTLALMNENRIVENIELTNSGDLINTYINTHLKIPTNF